MCVERGMKMRKRDLFMALVLAILIVGLAACDTETKGDGAGEELAEAKEESKVKEEAGVEEKAEGIKAEDKKNEDDKNEENKSQENMTGGGKTQESMTEGNKTQENMTEESKEPENKDKASDGELIFYENIRETDVSKGPLMLCSKNYRLPPDYEPENLLPVPHGYYVMDGKEYLLQAEVVEAFIRMADDASGLGLNIKVISGYRTQDYQTELYNSYGQSYGYDEADTYSARPRHSEHETGLCMDINMVTQDFQYTAEYEWLMANGASYGFILRYPEGKEATTGYVFEPWHWRYVGEKAVEIKRTGLTFDEYYREYIE